jgi:hypothetical protein
MRFLMLVQCHPRLGSRRHAEGVHQRPERSRGADESRHTARCFRAPAQLQESEHRRHDTMVFARSCDAQSLSRERLLLVRRRFRKLLAVSAGRKTEFTLEGAIERRLRLVAGVQCHLEYAFVSRLQ